MNENLKILVEDNKKLLDQVIVLLGKVNDDLYNKKSNFLIKHSIGQHFRHIYAFYYQFINGIVSGVIDYDSRIRDSRMESDCKYMLKSFSEISSKLNINKNSKIILSYQLDNSDKQEVDSSIERELVFLYSHSLHHIAMIRGVLESEYGFTFKENLGFTVSTINHKSSLI